jgi:hypothetical protein
VPKTEETNKDGAATPYQKRLQQLIGTLEDDRFIARLNIQRSQESQVQRHGRKLVDHRYNIGDKVLLKNFRIKKLAPKWTGPYFIHNVHTNGTFKLRTLNGKVRKKAVHADQIVPYVSRKNADETLPPILLEDPKDNLV